MAVGVALLESRWHPLGFAYQDHLLDNVPQYVSCSRYATPVEASAALTSFPTPAAVDGHVTDRCAGRAGIEFQYGSHRERLRPESTLRDHGHWVAGTGWFLRGLPVEMRNV